MQHKKLLAAAVAAGLAMATPAIAEPVRLAQAGPGVLPPHEIVTIVRSARLNPLDRPVRRGPNYVLRAVDAEGEEMRVVVDARFGDIVSVTPTMDADAIPPGGPRPPAYVGSAPMPPGSYDDEPPMIYREEAPIIYRGPPRPNLDVPVAGPLPPYPYRQSRPPSSVASAPLPPPIGSPPLPMGAAPSALGEPHDIMAPERGGEGGLLPPPPERFPQRVPPPTTAKKPPAAKPAAPKRTATAPAGNVPPLPKPRPPAKSAPQSDATPLPPPIPENKAAAEPLPHSARAAISTKRKRPGMKPGRSTLRVNPLCSGLS